MSGRSVAASRRALRRVLLLVFLSFSLLVGLLAGCGSERHDLAGRYEAVLVPEGGPPASLTLGFDGKGNWMLDGTPVPLNWVVDGGRVVFHTKSGGVLYGKRSERMLTVEVPGAGVYAFQRK